MAVSAIKATSPDVSFCFTEGWGDCKPGLQEPNAKPDRGMASLGRGYEDEAMLQLVTHSFSHLLHKHVLIRVPQ